MCYLTQALSSKAAQKMDIENAARALMSLKRHVRLRDAAEKTII